MLRKTKLGRHVCYFWVDIEKKCICFDIAVKKFQKDLNNNLPQ